MQNLPVELKQALDAPWLDDTTKMAIALMVRNGQTEEVAHVVQQINETQEILDSIAKKYDIEGGAAVLAQHVKDSYTATTDEKGNVTVTLKDEAKTQLLNSNVPGVSVKAKHLEASLKKLITVDFSGEGGGVPKFKIGAGVKGYEKAYAEVSRLQTTLGSRVQQKGLGSVQAVTVGDQKIEFIVNPESREVLLPPGNYSETELQAVAEEAARSLPADGAEQSFKINFQKLDDNGQPVKDKDEHPVLMSAVVTASIGADGKLQVDNVSAAAELEPAAAKGRALGANDETNVEAAERTLSRAAAVARYEAFSQLR